MMMASKRWVMSSLSSFLLLPRRFSSTIREEGIKGGTSPLLLSQEVPICPYPPSIHQFRDQWFEAQEPVVIKGAMEEWKARDWNIEMLVEKFGQDTVSVELSRWNSKKKRWGDYRDIYDIESGDNIFQPGHQMALEDFIEIFMRNMESKAPLRGYLAQQQLFDELPAMAEGIVDPEYPKVSKGIYQRNIWLGPAKTITPMHRDPYHNFLAQVWGSKYIRLYSPEHTAKLYPFTKGFHLRNTSQVDIGASDCFEKWPEFRNAPCFECELQAGEMIYIPMRWWHFVEAKTPSFSVSFWWV